MPRSSSACFVRVERRSTTGGGMRPKLQACLDAIHGGVSHAHIVDGRVPLLLHLLSPAGRPLQVTADLRKGLRFAGPVLGVGGAERGVQIDTLHTAIVGGLLIGTASMVALLSPVMALGDEALVAMPHSISTLALDSISRPISSSVPIANAQNSPFSTIVAVASAFSVGGLLRKSREKVMPTGLAIRTRTAKGSSLRVSGDLSADTARFGSRLRLEAMLPSTAASMSADWTMA